jgi:hypothetical protein
MAGADMHVSRFRSVLNSTALKPCCARVNLPLWYALRQAQVLRDRVVTRLDPKLEGLILPFLDDTLIVLDPDLSGLGYELLFSSAPLAPTRDIQKTPEPFTFAPGQKWLGRD